MQNKSKSYIHDVSSIRNFYPYYENRNHILWLYPKLVIPKHLKDSYSVFGEVTVILKNNTVKKIPEIILTPYKNRDVLLLCGKRAGNCALGVPILFSSFEEITSVDRITVCWIIYKEGYCQVMHVTFFLDLIMCIGDSKSCYSLQTRDHINIGFPDNWEYLSDCKNIRYYISDDSKSTHDFEFYRKPMTSKLLKILRMYIADCIPASGNETIEYFSLEKHCIL